MRLPRFTLRRLMILVAVAALALGLEMGRRRRDVFLALANTHLVKMTASRQMSDNYAINAKTQRAKAEKIRACFFLYWPKAVALDQLAGLVEAEATAHASIAEHHSRMREKYRRAARFPFWPVEPDPPAPPDPNDL